MKIYPCARKLSPSKLIGLLSLIRLLSVETKKSKIQPSVLPVKIYSKALILITNNLVKNIRYHNCVTKRSVAKRLYSSVALKRKTGNEFFVYIGVPVYQ